MSVIFGIHEIDKITLVADRRDTIKSTNKFTDDLQKIFIINDTLSIAIAGNEVMSRYINDEIDKFNAKPREQLTTDDITYIIANAYDKIKKLSPNALRYSFCCIYAGLDNSGKAAMIAGRKSSNSYICNKVDEYIFAPEGMEQEECNKILVRNYIFIRGDFYANILHEVSDQSIYVSSCGDMWVFDIPTQKGTLTKIQGKEESR